MCGIVAIISNREDLEELTNEMLEAIEHRGRDFRGIYSNGRVSLGHNRLSINDLSEKGNQPFHRYKIHSITNGEIWNHEAMRYDTNTYYESSSDCEVIIPRYKKGRLNELDGMFSSIILDEEENKVTLLRDWVGKIPLYMVKTGNEIFIASEIKAIRKATEDENVKFVPKNSRVTIDIDTLEIKTEENFFGGIQPAVLDRITDERVAEFTYELLDNAVKKRTISDVPIATLNSGGIDSSVITYLLSKYIKDIKCYTVKFDEESPDLQHARLLADYLGVELIEVEVPRDPIEIKKRFNLVNRVIEFPSSVQTQCGVMTSYLMERISKDGHKVVFSGEGSDESAGSYKRMQMFKNKPDWCDLKKAFFEKQYYGNLLRGNNIGMYFGTLETRTPFFDRDYVRFVCNLGSEYTYGDGKQRKKHLAEAFRGKIPDAILDREKETFQAGTCFQDWFEKIILEDKDINFNSRTKVYHVVCDDIERQLKYSIRNARKFEFQETSQDISDLFN